MQLEWYCFKVIDWNLNTYSNYQVERDFVIRNKNDMQYDCMLKEKFSIRFKALQQNLNVHTGSTWIF